ncbi:unnamed protein product [Sphenostylis stenocarpa]|uniref:Uncharacterized protein n=1 Tax=Sphenostylis stenocarpa TaxID=92480 RepID=A0AA86VE85_9FABA|nr:unnamed protein product [Sphenostylis stenocarpa]
MEVEVVEVVEEDGMRVRLVMVTELRKGHVVFFLDNARVTRVAHFEPGLFSGAIGGNGFSNDLSSGRNILKLSAFIIRYASFK